MKTILISSVLGLALVSGAALAATSEAKAVYVQTKDRADADYKAARVRCDAITGNPKDVCVAEAKAMRVRTVEEANAL